MQGFEDVTLTWQGQSYIVPANRQMMLIAVIEDALSGASGQQALTVLFRREGPPYSKLAAAFGAALRHAGARVSDEDVYLSMMEDMAHKSKADVTEMIQATIVALLSIIAPPAARALTGGEPAPVDTSEKKG
jgi:hypothetical protein